MSRKTEACGVLWRIDAGQETVTGPSSEAAHRLRLAGFGDDGQHPCGTEQCGDGDGDRLGGNIVIGGEVSLVNLLGPARRVQGHHLHILRVVEIGHRRVVEGQVPVLADTQAAEVEGVVAQERRVPLALCRRRRPPVEVVGRLGLGGLHDPLADPALEAGRMVGTDPEILVHVEDDDVAPRHVGSRSHQLVNEGDLGVPGGEHGVGDALFGHRGAQDPRRPVGGGAGHGGGGARKRTPPGHLGLRLQAGS